MADSDAKRVNGLVREFENVVHATTGQIRADLERARMLVYEATTQLERSFDALRSAAIGQREALQSVASAFYDTDHGGRSFASATETLMRQFVDELVRISRDSVRIIEQLSDLSIQVTTIVGAADAIDGLARETRFIAFNARIETHRAGEAGRTFKVVADEVKRLANASANLSGQIRQSVSECNEKLAQVHKTSTGLASHDLNRAIDSHRGLSNAIGKLDAVNQELDGMLDRIVTCVSDAMRALQFQDMVAQLLNATVARVQKLGDCSIRALQIMTRAHGVEHATRLSEVVEVLRGSERAAVQPSLEQGPAEAF
jgi:methyl-accepting chemotaxis protein